MPFEEFEDKIKQAADHHHPAYDEKAWVKMEKLLDKHLPQEEKRKRRFIFFLLFFLLLGGGAWLLVSKPWQANNKITAAKPEPGQHPSAEINKTNPAETIQNKLPGAIEKNPSETVQGNVAEVVEIKLPSTKYPANGTPSLRKSTIKENVSLVSQQKNKPEEKTASLVMTQNNKPAGDPRDIVNHTAVERLVSGNEPVATSTISPANQPVTNESKPVSSLPNETTEEKKDEQKNIVIAKKDEPVQNETQSKKSTAKKKNGNSFFLSLSAGPDISFLNSGKAGTTKLLAGGGLGYTFNNRLTVRTGFYTSRKVYTAAPDAYNPPASFWTYYPYLEKVDADCKVYEIPLSLSYNFGNKPKQNWFASAGISSLLMKKETYNYFYKYAPNTPTINKTWTIEDENKHYFSVLTLSAGYQRRIGKQVFITAEPYLKLPLSGVGYGKVKLNSGGILFTIGFNPFAKKSTEASKPD